MAHGSNRLEKHLLSARGRQQLALADGAQYESSIRLSSLRSSLEKIGPDGDAEMYRYFPIASIAILETHFKSTVTVIVNSGSPYLERGLNLVKDRLRTAADFFPPLHRKTITVGELVAHQLPFNSISSYDETLGALLEVNVKSFLRTVQEPQSVRSDLNVGPLVSDIDELWRALVETFEQRHILAHEAASKYIVTYEHARSSVRSAQAITRALDAMLWATVWKEEPLTQFEMNSEAWDRYRQTRSAFAKNLLRARRVTQINRQQKAFNQIHRSWKRYALAWACWEEESFGSGSIRPLIAANVRDRLMRSRDKDLTDWLAWSEDH